MRAKTELAKYCPIIIKTITLIAKTPKKIFLTIGLAGFFNQFIPKSTHHPTNKKPLGVGFDVNSVRCLVITLVWVQTLYSQIQRWFSELLHRGQHYSHT